MLSIENDELVNAPNLKEKILCSKCGKFHNIEYGKEVLEDGTKKPSKTLAFYSCKGKTYLAGINGKKI